MQRDGSPRGQGATPDCDAGVKYLEMGRIHRHEEETMKLYVGNLNYKTTETELREVFGAHGQVTSVAVITDRETGRAKGFGFVEFANDEDAKAAIAALDGKEIGGRSLKVNESRPQERSSGGGYGGGGGRGGDRGGERRGGWR
jgi:RNA recognition motif-containing protein